MANVGQMKMTALASSLLGVRRVGYDSDHMVKTSRFSLHLSEDVRIDPQRDLLW